jgi:hypothetical protein
VFPSLKKENKSAAGAWSTDLFPLLSYQPFGLGGVNADRAHS